ncbi:MAG: NUDIX domain-containing protein [Pedobacter sp.]|nr:MAG: NUDIX domain-containing protein [Pedobacter sp.]
MSKYPQQSNVLIAVDCIIFGFDGEHVKILLIKRSFEPAKDEWSLMGGFVGDTEPAEGAAQRILTELTGLQDVYLEQFKTYSEPNRDPIARTVSIAYFALIDIHKYEKQLNNLYHAEWFLLEEAPKLIFDHNQMVEDARKKLRYNASMHPILFELLPKKFTIPQLQNLYEQVYSTRIDNRNFIRKLNSTKLLIKLDEKDKSSSKRGAFYFELDQARYKAEFQSFFSFMPNPEV